MMWSVNKLRLIISLDVLIMLTIVVIANQIIRSLATCSSKDHLVCTIISGLHGHYHNYKHNQFLAKLTSPW